MGLQILVEQLLHNLCRRRCQYGDILSDIYEDRYGQNSFWLCLIHSHTYVWRLLRHVS